MGLSIEKMAEASYPQDVININESELLQRGYKKGASHMLIKAILWLRKNKDNLDFIETDGCLYGESFVKAFAEAMD